MKYICPLVTVSDITVARIFYEKVLNQVVKYDFGENVTYHGDFAIHLKSHFADLIDGKEIKAQANNFELYFEEDELDQLVERLEQRDVEFVHELREQPWKQRVIRFYDPDKNIIEVGESLESVCKRLSRQGNSKDEIIEMVGVSGAFVEQTLCEE